MGKKRKLQSEEKRVNLALLMHKKLRSISEEESAKIEDAKLAWDSTINRFHKWIEGLIKEKPQEKTFILSAFKKLQNAFVVVREARLQSKQKENSSTVE